MALKPRSAVSPPRLSSEQRRAPRCCSHQLFLDAALKQQRWSYWPAFISLSNISFQPRLSTDWLKAAGKSSRGRQQKEKRKRQQEEAGQGSRERQQGGKGERQQDKAAGKDSRKSIRKRQLDGTRAQLSRLRPCPGCAAQQESRGWCRAARAHPIQQDGSPNSFGLRWWVAHFTPFRPAFPSTF